MKKDRGRGTLFQKRTEEKSPEFHCYKINVVMILFAGLSMIWPQNIKGKITSFSQFPYKLKVSFRNQSSKFIFWAPQASPFDWPQHRERPIP